jgi:flagellar secretion chaperone FliS
MIQRGLNAYRQTEVQSRTQLELVVMLYDGALRFLASASDAIAHRDIRARRDAVSRLLAIVSELQSTLDIERGGDLARTLDELYSYMTKRIMDAAMHNDAGALLEVERLIRTLRDAWLTVASGDAVPASGPVPITSRSLTATP